MTSTIFCVCFSRDLCVSSRTTKNEIICSKTMALSRGTSQMASGIGFSPVADIGTRLYALALPEMAMFASNGSNRDKYTESQRHHGPLMIPVRHLCEAISRYQTVLYSINMVIVGYWVGPDVEDGWGYIEATVDQIFNFKG